MADPGRRLCIGPPFAGELPAGVCVERTAVLITRPVNDGGTR